MVVLVFEDSFHCGHINVRFFCLSFRKIPTLDLSFHSPIFFFEVPDTTFERTILIFDLIDQTFKSVIFVPYNILGCFIPIEINGRLKDVVIGIYLFPKMLFVAYSFV